MGHTVFLQAIIAFALTSAVQAADFAPPPIPAGPASDVELRITPFFWASGLNGVVGTRHNFPTVNVDVDFIDILRNLDFSAMVAGEYRNGRWGMLADLTCVAVSIEQDRDLAARLPGFTSASLQSKTFNATATGF